VLDARRRPSQLCFSQYATRTVDNTVDLYAASEVKVKVWTLAIAPLT